ncbi:hypothetical protein M513_08089, partial [Trichuris suis]
MWKYLGSGSRPFGRTNNEKKKSDKSAMRMALWSGRKSISSRFSKTVGEHVSICPSLINLKRVTVIADTPCKYERSLSCDTFSSVHCDDKATRQKAEEVGNDFKKQLSLNNASAHEEDNLLSSSSMSVRACRLINVGPTSDDVSHEEHKSENVATEEVVFKRPATPPKVKSEMKTDCALG